MSLIKDIKNGVRLPSSEFTLYRHCSYVGDSPLDIWNFETNEPRDGWIYVGWCPSASTVIPSSNWGKDYPIAVLLEYKHDSEIKVWCHIPTTDELVCAAFGYYQRRSFM